MELFEVFEAFKKGTIAKGAKIKMHGSDKVYKIQAINNVTEIDSVFDFVVYESEEVWQSADIKEIVSGPYTEEDVFKKKKNSDIPISFATTPLPLKTESEVFISIQPKVLDYLTKRMNNKKDKCPIIEESIGLLNKFQSCNDKDILADVLIKLSTKLNELL